MYWLLSDIRVVSLQMWQKGNHREEITTPLFTDFVYKFSLSFAETNLWQHQTANERFSKVLQKSNIDIDCWKFCFKIWFSKPKLHYKRFVYFKRLYLRIDDRCVILVCYRYYSIRFRNFYKFESFRIHVTVIMIIQKGKPLYIYHKAIKQFAIYNVCSWERTCVICLTILKFIVQMIISIT